MGHDLSRRKPPRAMCLLGIVVAVFGLSWALLVPPLQAPDENVHFAYVQSLADRHALPGNPHQPSVSSEQTDSTATVGAFAGRRAPGVVPPNWSTAAWKTFLAQDRADPPSRSNGGGPNRARYPPLYYLYGAVGYSIDHGGTFFGRLYAVRTWGIWLLEATMVGAWLLAGEIFGRRRRLQFITAAVATLWPMATFIITSVNPDALLVPLWTFALWLGVRVVKRRAPMLDTTILCGVTAAAILTQPEAWAMLAPTVSSLAFAWYLSDHAERSAVLARELKALTALVLPVLGWELIAYIVHAQVPQTSKISAPRSRSIVGFLEYVWQFYLPRLPFMARNAPYSLGGAYTVLGYQGVGQFGWLTISLPSRIYPVVIWIACAVAAVAFASILRRGSTQTLLLATIGTGLTLIVLSIVHQSRYQSTVPVLLILAAGISILFRTKWLLAVGQRDAIILMLIVGILALVAVLHVVEYATWTAGNGTFIQARYLLPFGAVLGLAVAMLTERLPKTLAITSAGLVLTGLFVWQLLSLAAVLRGFYL